MTKRMVVVGFSGGVSSAWCAGWALRTFDPREVAFVFHDTKEEDPDTYRFIRELAKALNHPITEVSDGRSVTEIIYDENMIPNNRAAFCSRILKTEQRDKYFKQLRSAGATEIVNVLGFSMRETERIQRAAGRAMADGYAVRFPLIEEKVSKQETADWVMSLGIRPPAMYRWSEHANCVGCVRGGKAYWLAVAKNAPEVFEQRAALEEEFDHTILKDTTLRNLVQVGLKRKVNARESIDIGPCECGD